MINSSELIDLKFNDKYISWVEQGRKICTTRKSVKGKAGDHFMLNGKRYVITGVLSCKLFALFDLYHLEGYSCAQCFYEDLLKIYPGLHMNDIFHMHFFETAYDYEMGLIADEY